MAHTAGLVPISRNSVVCLSHILLVLRFFEAFKWWGSWVGGDSPTVHAEANQATVISVFAVSLAEWDDLLMGPMTIRLPHRRDPPVSSLCPVWSCGTALMPIALMKIGAVYLYHICSRRSRVQKGHCDSVNSVTLTLCPVVSSGRLSDEKIIRAEIAQSIILMGEQRQRSSIKGVGHVVGMRYDLKLHGKLGVGRGQ